MAQVQPRKPLSQPCTSRTRRAYKTPATSISYQFSTIRDSNMALKLALVFCTAVLLVVTAAPADVEQLSEGGPEKEDLQTAASHWGGHWGGYGGYGGHWGGWGGYYPYYGGYWSYPLYGHGYGWPYGYGHHGYWWK